MRSNLDFAGGMIQGALRCRGKKCEDGKVLDWKKAMEIILNMNPKTVEAGLMEDWDCTSAIIWKNGKKVTPIGGYFGSLWATPILVVDGEEIECYKQAKKGDVFSQAWSKEKKNEKKSAASKTRTTKKSPRKAKESNSRRTSSKPRGTQKIRGKGNRGAGSKN